MRTITKKELTESLITQTGIGKTEAKRAVDDLVAEMANLLCNKVALKIKYYGWLTPSFKKGGREVRIVKTGETMPMPDRWCVYLSKRRHVEDKMCRSVMREHMIELGMKPKVVEVFFDTFHEAIEMVYEGLVRIEIRGLGSFSLREYEPREVRNPKTGHTFIKEATKRVHYRVSKCIVRRLNEK